jgi:hypothetical protein
MEFSAFDIKQRSVVLPPIGQHLPTTGFIDVSNGPWNFLYILSVSSFLIDLKGLTVSAFGLAMAACAYGSLALFYIVYIFMAYF